MNNTRYITVTLTTVLVLLFLSVLARKNESLADPLINISFEVTPERNEKLIDDGIILPPIIEGYLEQGDYVITKTVTVPKEAHLHIAEHSRIFANTDARILVQGEVSAKNVSFQSNELHADCTIWHGIVIDREGSINFSDISISNATAGLTCAGTGKIQQSTFQNNTVAVVLLPNSSCVMEDITIQHSSVGIHAIKTEPVFKNITFRSVLEEIRILK
jgi:hypothetical protein